MISGPILSLPKIKRNKFKVSMMVERVFLAVPWGCMWFVIVVFPDHNHLLFLTLCLLVSSAVLITFADIMTQIRPVKTSGQIVSKL